jgi:predicted Rossmann fold nucleotide-binding protein DprA/Smf involved in DNA uptake
VDSTASHGALQLLRDGGAALVMNPREVLDLLETPARHVYAGTHASRYGGEATAPPPPDPAPAVVVEELSQTQRALVEALASVRTLDEVSRLTGLDAGVVRADATLLELKGVLQRAGGELVVRGARRPSPARST